MISRPTYFNRARLASASLRRDVDVCVYGGTSAGVVAGRTLAELGHSVVIVNPAAKLGGMTTHGLGCTDVGNPSIVGGLARRAYEEIGAAYGRTITWRFEPHVAQQVIDRLSRHAKIEVIPFGYVDGCLVEPSDSSSLREARITEIALVGGARVRARAFVDASYEGDLMARAGVPFRVGREPAGLFGESLAGVQLGHGHQFPNSISPWVVEDDPESGVINGVEPHGWTSDQFDQSVGMGDERLQAFNFRLCMTQREAIRAPFTRPDDYNAAEYELARRWLRTTSEDIFLKFDAIPGDKTDTNNHGAFSSDRVGGSSAWPGSDYQSREQIFQDHVSYHRGLLWFMSHDPAVPDDIRIEFRRWGLAVDEFVDSENWPEQLYVREARRMYGVSTLTERHCRGNVDVPDPIAMGAYQMDSHNCRRMIIDNCVQNEGDVQLQLDRPYQIPLGCVLPPEGSVGNLVVPVATSATHIAFGSVRMEPVFMMLAEGAAVALHEALVESISVQRVPYAQLETVLLSRGQVLATSESNVRGHQNAEGWMDE